MLTVRTVYHRDLKPENLILNEDGTSLHLADFGLATPTPTIHGGGGSAEYLSPGACTPSNCLHQHYLTSRTESFDQDASGRGAAKADVWALGIVLFHMLTGLLPWDIAHDSNANFACFLAHPCDYFARFFAVPADVNALLVRLLAADPAARPALPDIRAAVERLGPLFTPGQRSTTYFHARRGVAITAADSASGSDEGSFLALTDEEDAGDDGDDEDDGDVDNDDDDDDDDEDNSSDDVLEDEFPAPAIADVSGAKAHDLTEARSPIEKPAVHRLPLPYGRGSVDLEVKDGILVALPMDRLLL
jgi:serine/threonine protein kinase